MFSIFSPVTRSGVYYFYGSVDDVMDIYGAHMRSNGSFSEETKLLSASYPSTTNGQYYPTCAGCKASRSAGVHLFQGERFRLRVRVTNSATMDMFEVPMKIELTGHQEQVSHRSKAPSGQPTFLVWNATQAPTLMPSTSPSLSPTRTPSAVPTAPTAKPSTSLPTRKPTHSPSFGMGPTKSPSQNPTPSPSFFPSWNPTRNPTAHPTTSSPSAMPTLEPTQGIELQTEFTRQQRNLSPTFMRQHSLKDVQLLSLQIPYYYETQVKEMFALY
jgi:hypothetical protein